MLAVAGITPTGMEAAGRMSRSPATSVDTRTGGSTDCAGGAEVNRSAPTRAVTVSLSESFLTAGPRAPFTPPDSRPPEEVSWAADRPARDRKPEVPSRVEPAAADPLRADESVDSSGDAPATPEVRQPAAAPIPRATAKPPTLPTNTEARMTPPRRSSDDHRRKSPGPPSLQNYLFNVENMAQRPLRNQMPRSVKCSRQMHTGQQTPIDIPKDFIGCSGPKN